MALLLALLIGAASPTDLNRQLLTAGLPDQLASRLLLRVLGRARGLVHRPALFGTLTVAHFLCGSVTLSHCLIESLLLEGDLTGLLKVFFANLLEKRRDLIMAKLFWLYGPAKVRTSSWDGVNCVTYV